MLWRTEALIAPKITTKFEMANLYARFDTYWVGPEEFAFRLMRLDPNSVTNPHAKDSHYIENQEKCFW